MNVFSRLRHLWRPLAALAILAALAFVFRGHALAAPAVQGGADIGSNQVIVALLSLLAVGALGSVVTGVLRSLGGTLGLDPKVLLYVVCAVIAFVIQATVGLPSFTGDPGLFWADALIFVQTSKTGAEVLYGLLLKNLLPEPAPDA